MFRSPPSSACGPVLLRSLVSVSVVSVVVHWDTWHMGDAWGASDQQVSAALGSWGLGVVGVDNRVVVWGWSMMSWGMVSAMVGWGWSVVCWLGWCRVVSQSSGDGGEENQSDDLVHDDCVDLIWLEPLGILCNTTLDDAWTVTDD